MMRQNFPYHLKFYLKLRLAYSRHYIKESTALSLGIQSKCGEMSEKYGPEQLRIRTFFMQ